MRTNAAPKFNKVVISPPKRKHGADPERVGAAIYFGAALQELVARGRLRSDATGPVAQASGPRFPTDLSNRRKPEDALRATYEKLRKLERTVVLGPHPPESKNADGASPTPAGYPGPTDGSGGASGFGSYYGPLPGPTVGTIVPSPEPGDEEEITAPESPSRKVGRKIKELLRAREEDGELGNLYHHLSGEDGLDHLVGEWDAYVVGRIGGDAPRTLAGYKVGKALGLTRWTVWATRYQTPAEDASEAWNRAFAGRRIGEIQRQINALNDVLDPEALTITATSLGYWRNALLSMPDILDGGAEATNRARRETIRIPAGKEDELEEALERQLDNWLDLLAGRRPPGSFPVAGIVSTVTKNLTTGLLARGLRLLVPSFAALSGLALLPTMALLISTVAGQPPPPLEGEPATTGVLGGLGAVLSVAFAALAARGRASFDRGDVDQLRARVDDLAKQLGGSSLPGSWEGLKEDVLSQLVKQIRLEELNIAVSEPLVGFVLALNDDESDDPQEDAKRFLRLAYGNRSNLDRLLPIFQEVFKYFRTAPPG